MSWEERMAQASRERNPRYGDPGEQLPDNACRECYGERYTWAGNFWAIMHKPYVSGMICQHSCHEGQGPMMAGSCNCDSGPDDSGHRWWCELGGAWAGR